MDGDLMSSLAHGEHPIAAPLDDRSVDALLAHALPRGDERVLDLGCGNAQWLLRALAVNPQAHAVGIDRSQLVIERGQRHAAREGVTERLRLRVADAAAYPVAERFDVVLSVGATHAFGGLSATLAAAGRHLTVDGRVLVGEGFWAGTPGPGAVAMLGELADLPTLVDTITSDGWTPVYGHVSTREELDGYEWAWTGTLSSWALDNPDHPDSGDALAAAAAHRSEWLRDYRDSFGFVCAVLRRTP